MCAHGRRAPRRSDGGLEAAGSELVVGDHPRGELAPQRDTRLVVGMLHVPAQRVRVVEGRVDGEVMSDGTVADVPAELPEADPGDRALERAEGLDALHDSRV